MIISYKHRVTFLAVPRTASRSIHQYLIDTSGEENMKVFGGYHGRDLPSEFAHWFSFAVVRHPYTRAVSFWMKATQLGPRRAELLNDGVELDNLYTRCGGEQPFSEFVKWLATKRPADPIEWGNMTSFTHGIRLNQILRFEHLHRDFKKLPFVGKNFELPWVGKQLGDDDWRKYYEDPQVAEAVRGWANVDFEQFGYCPRYHITNKPFIQ